MSLILFVVNARYRNELDTKLKQCEKNAIKKDDNGL